MCDHSNAKTIAEELLLYLETADYSIRETLVGPRIEILCRICVYAYVHVFRTQLIYVVFLTNYGVLGYRISLNNGLAEINACLI